MFDESANRHRGFASIAAFQLTEDTRRNLANVISVLSNTWYYFPDDKQWKSYVRKIDICLKDDEECGRLWRGVVRINRLIISAPEEPIKVLYKLYRKVKYSIKK